MKTKMKYGLPALLVLVVLVLSIAGCTKDDAGNKPGTNEVWLQNTAFLPNELTVPVNTTVKWLNKDNMQHTVTSDSGTFDSGTMDVNGVYTHTFSQKGQYPYHCSFHSNMTAKVVVQ